MPRLREMSTTRYLEISSTYRDRNSWPQPAEFEVPIAESGSADKNNARDPICLSEPVTKWVSNALANQAGVSASITFSSVAPTPLGYSSQGDTAFLQTSSPLRAEDNYYVGLVLFDSATPLPLARRVTFYRYVGFDGSVYIGEFMINATFDSITLPAVMYDPTDLSVQSNVQVFIPNGRIAENGYPDLYLYNETRGTWAPVLYYDEITHMLSADASAVSPFNWSVQDAYSIRAQKPIFTGVSSVISTTTFVLNATNAGLDNEYRGDFLRVANVGTSRTYPAPIYETRKIIKHFVFSTTFATTDPGVTNAFTLAYNPQLVNINGYYVGAQLYTSVGGPYTVATYDASTRSGTITGVFGGEVVGDSVYTRTVIVNPAFTSAPSASSLELLLFTRDSFNPLTFIGSELSQQQAVCYEIQLVNLALPNRLLNVYRGGQAAFYPNLYVELVNVTSSNSGVQNIIYSNNPYSKKMLFRVPVDDIPAPIISTFIKLDGDGTTQTVKFKPNDNLKFSVRFDNGVLFENYERETYSPQEPNPLIQISALFSLRRLTN